MAKYVKTNIESIILDMEKFKKHVKEDLINKGLDKTLHNSVKKLQRELYNVLTTMRDNRQFTAQEIQDGVVEIPKAEEEILKQLTGVDVQNFNSTKDYTNFTESNIVFAHQNQGSGAFRRVRLRLPMEAGDSYANQLEMAKEFFNKAIFAIPDEAGDIKYYVNPGIDLDKYVKVVCSTQRGDDPTTESEDRFDRAISNNDYAEWSIFQNTIDEVITQQFVDITPVINDLKLGDPEEALRKLKNENQIQKIQELTSKVSNITEKISLTPGMKAYNNLIQLIKTLKITKATGREKVMYALKAEYSETPNKEGTDQPEDIEREFYNRLRSAISMWKVSNKEKWFEAFVKIAERVLLEAAKKSITIVE